MSTTTGTTAGRREGRDVKDTLGRVGLVGQGVLYAVLGGLAIQLAVGDLENEASLGGAIEWVGSQPLGRFLLVALTVSLFAMAAWRLLDAVWGDPVEGEETTDRIKFAAKGVFFLAVAVVSAAATISNWNGGSSSSGSGGGASREQQATSTVLEWPGGRWLVALAGLAAIGYAVYTVKRDTVDEEFVDRLDVSEGHWVVPFGRFGYAARAVTYVLVGWFLVQAGLSHEPGQAKGLSQALQELPGNAWGQALLWVVALGLIAYGLFSLAEAKFRRAA